ncbi:MAG TPA: fibrillarin-like rRNA/tRNA 2'-O-methyltransferase [Nitrososphaeraceae archaeon]|jgi:fibrillarin-like pre-rRNA processing protein
MSIWVRIEGQKQLATPNLVAGDTVYGEKLVKLNNEEYRVWDAFRSKLAAALRNGLTIDTIRNGTKVLYLGASTGTTVSHVSDIVGPGGLVFAVESASRVARELLENVAKKRKNVVPILGDARKPEMYFSIFGKVDVVYSDVAQQDQTDIAIQNCQIYLKTGGSIFLIVKSRSIDVVADPKLVIRNQIRKLEASGFSTKQVIGLEPYDIDHAIIRGTYD